MTGLVLRRCYDPDTAASLLGTTRRALWLRLKRRSEGRRAVEPTPGWWRLDNDSWLLDADSTDLLAGITPDAARGFWRVLPAADGAIAGAPTAALAGVLAASEPAGDAHSREREARELAQAEATVEREARLAAENELAAIKAAAEHEETLRALGDAREQIRRLQLTVEVLDSANNELAGQIRRLAVGISTMP